MDITHIFFAQQVLKRLELKFILVIPNCRNGESPIQSTGKSAKRDNSRSSSICSCASSRRSRCSSQDTASFRLDNSWRIPSSCLASDWSCLRRSICVNNQDGKAKQLYFKSPHHLVKQFTLVYICSRSSPRKNCKFMKISNFLPILVIFGPLVWPLQYLEQELKYSCI